MLVACIDSAALENAVDEIAMLGRDRCAWLRPASCNGALRSGH